jgi:hypothetical protein
VRRQRRTVPAFRTLARSIRGDATRFGVTL